MYTNSLCKWEKGRCQPTLINAIWLSAVIGCPIEILFMEHFQVIRATVNRRRAKVKLKFPEL
jgi:DNA-binding XRE family transcriptional regulator